MPDIRYCLDCSNVAELNQHGRCACCDSNAVALAESMNAWEPPVHDTPWERRHRDEIMELEDLFRLVAKAS